jgi:HK97 gp10 family phage protein
MTSRDIEMRGTADVLKTLQRLGQRIETGAIRAGLTASAAIIRDEAKMRAPKRTGKLARAIRSGSARKNQDGTFSIRVYVDERRSGGFVGYFVEYGVKPHLIARKASKQGPATLKAKVSQGEKVGGVMKIGDRFVSGVISHPGHAARPFLRPALDIKANEAVKAFRDRIAAYVEGKTGFDMNAGLAEAA